MHNEEIKDVIQIARKKIEHLEHQIRQTWGSNYQPWMGTAQQHATELQAAKDEQVQLVHKWQTILNKREKRGGNEGV